jgi:restriction system protein
MQPNLFKLSRCLARIRPLSHSHQTHPPDGSALPLVPNGTLLPGGTQLVYKNRAGWAHDRLKRAGLSSSPRRGYWKLTDKGFAFSQSHPARLTEEVVKELAVVDPSVRLRPLTTDGDQDLRPLEQNNIQDSVSTPDDRLEGALTELRDAAGHDLLETIGRGSPKFFETLVLDLLHAMGYGASRTDLQHVGRSGDGGIDGIISLDRLGLEKVFVQAKRWQKLCGPGGSASVLWST